MIKRIALQICFYIGVRNHYNTIGLFHDNHPFAAQKYSMLDFVWWITCAKSVEGFVRRAVYIFVFAISISLQITGTFYHENFLNWTSIVINVFLILPTHRNNNLFNDMFGVIEQTNGLLV